MDGRVVCERCGADVPPGKDDGTYARGAGALARTRVGIRLLTVLVFGGGSAIAMALGANPKIVSLVAIGVLVVGAAYAIIQINRTPNG